MSDEMKRNSEGYSDPTAYTAMRNIEIEEKAKKLFSVLRYIISNSGFNVVEIKVSDKRSGKIYKF